MTGLIHRLDRKPTVPISRSVTREAERRLWALGGSSFRRHGGSDDYVALVVGNAHDFLVFTPHIGDKIPQNP